MRRSRSLSFLICLLTVSTLVSVPPTQRTVTYGISTDSAAAFTKSLCCFLVPTKRIFLPFLAISVAFGKAASRASTVFSRLIIWASWRLLWIYGAIFGCQRLVLWPKWAPLSSKVFISTFTVIWFPFLRYEFIQETPRSCFVKFNTRLIISCL